MKNDGIFQYHFRFNLFLVALTDGKVVLMDAELRPTLRHNGVLCENTRGKWSVRCVRRLEIQKNAELAGQTCTMLGFSGYSSHNVVMVNKDGEFKHKPSSEISHRVNLVRQSFFDRHTLPRLYKRSTMDMDINAFLHASQDENDLDMIDEIVGAPRECFALSIQCIPHMTLPIVNPDPEMPSDVTTVAPQVPQTTTTIAPAKTNSTSNDSQQAKPLEPIIQPNKVPHTFVPISDDNQTQPDIITENFNAQWLASIFIDGDLVSIGVLLDRYWVLSEKTVIDTVKYENSIFYNLLLHFSIFI